MGKQYIIDFGKYLAEQESRIVYIIDIKGEAWREIGTLLGKVRRLKESIYDIPENKLIEEVEELDSRIAFLERKAAETLSAAEVVNIVRNPQRFTLQDILENVYDSFTELGGDGECNIDPAVVVARATISRRVKNKIHTLQVMVIGHEKGKGEEFRNGGSAKPWGNEKALRYMRIAEREGIPIHSYIFTPGAFPIEDYPGAAQAIARNLFFMAKLKVPVVSFISEGGSGGAEAIGLSDFRLMASRGYYSVISPEGAAAIEGRIREGEKVPRQLVEHCAKQLCMTAKSNLSLGTIDRIVEEPPLGAKRDDFSFFKRLRYEVMRATDEVVLKTKSFRALRAYAMSRQNRQEEKIPEEFQVHIDWNLTDAEKQRLLELRSQKYRAMGQGFKEIKPSLGKRLKEVKEATAHKIYDIRYGLLRQHRRTVKKMIEEMSSEGQVLLRAFTEPWRAAYDFFIPPTPHSVSQVNSQSPGSIFTLDWEPYVSPLANEDRTITCPNAEKYGCQDLWVPDLYGEFCGVCPTCGHHFPLEYRWYLENLFDKGTVREFSQDIVSANPLNFEGLDKKLEAARKRTGRQSGIITFDAEVCGIKMVAAMLYSDFRSGTVGCAEGEKFVRACDRARALRRPFLAYIHTTGGIRIQEGTLGVVQMPRCTVAVREYLDCGGLYIVVYDNNSYAGPVASFLGCSPFQVGIRSSRIGFAGPRVIRETTGEDIPPDYHSAKNALKRGHIQGIWDRRDFRKNLFEAMITMGGPFLYYK